MPEDGGVYLGRLIAQSCSSDLEALLKRLLPSSSLLLLHDRRVDDVEGVCLCVQRVSSVPLLQQAPLPVLIRRGEVAAAAFRVSSGADSVDVVEVYALDTLLVERVDPRTLRLNHRVQRLMTLLYPRPLRAHHHQQRLEGADVANALLDSVKPVWPEAAPDPPGLVHPLLPFQARALAWMIGREHVREQHDDDADDEERELHPLFEELMCPDGSRLYYCRSSGVLTRHRVPYRGSECLGGLLCQAMGLGKTIEVIALILACRAPTDAVKTTLVVCPRAIFGQWKLELARHAPTLSVLMHAEVSPRSKLPTSAFTNADVVLTTYDVLRALVHYRRSGAASKRRLRSGAPRQLTPPLPDVCWWRVVLDEAQMVAGGTSLGAESARRLLARSRWVVTGTPVAGRLRDLGGLLAFIRHQPFETTSLFNRTLLVDNDLDKLRRILGEVMLRHRQEDVACDVSIPHLKVETVHVLLSPVEQTCYDRLFRQCQEILLSSSTSMANRFRRVRVLLTNLRKACCYPVFRGAGESAAEVSLQEVKLLLRREAEMELERSRRELIAASNQVAMLYALQGELKQAQMLYLDALAVTERAVAVLKPVVPEDGEPRERVRLLLALGVTLETQGDVNGALKQFERSERLGRARLERLIRDVQDEIRRRHSQGRVDDGLKETFEEQGWLCTLALLRLMNGDRQQPVRCLRRIDQAVSEALQQHLDTVQAAIDETDAMRRCMEGQMIDVIEWKVPFAERALLQDLLRLQFAALSHLLEEAQGNAPEQVEELRAKLDQNRAIAMQLSTEQHDDASDENFLRTRCWSRSWLQVDASSGEMLVTLAASWNGIARAHEKLREERPQELVQLISERRHQARTIEVAFGSERAPLDAATSAWLALQFSCLRGLLHVHERLVSYDETARSYWERSFTIREELKNTYKEAMQVEHIWMGEKLPQISLERALKEQHDAETAMQTRQHEFEFMRRRFDLGERGLDTDEICPICRERPEQAMLTRCGHLFCVKCLQLLLKQERKSACPVCRARVVAKHCFVVHADASNSLSSPSSVPSAASVFGAKTDELLRRIVEIRQRDPDAKCLVFSQWTPFLKLIALSLEKSGIRSAGLQGSVEQASQNVSRFLHDRSICVFLIPMKAGASGLTMVAAQYAFIMDPDPNPALEAQAESRIHRIGQTQPTVVSKFIVPDSIEERVVCIRERRRAQFGAEGVRIKRQPELWDDDTILELFDLYRPDDVSVARLP